MRQGEPPAEAVCLAYGSRQIEFPDCACQGPLAAAPQQGNKKCPGFVQAPLAAPQVTDQTEALQSSADRVGQNVLRVKIKQFIATMTSQHDLGAPAPGFVVAEFAYEAGRKGWRRQLQILCIGFLDPFRGSLDSRPFEAGQLDNTAYFG